MAFDVGQGNCNALVGSNGTIVAYFDFGYSTENAKQPAPPTHPCLCDSPPIILSHWDRDHLNMAYEVPKSLTMDWVVPESGHSTFATKLQGKIKAAGGRLHAVPFAGGRRHQRFPWGFVERCSAGYSDPNGSGLAAFVCVRNAPAHPVVVGGVAALPVLASSGPAVWSTRARTAYIAAYPPGAVGRVARPLAVVLAASQTVVGRQPRMPVPECVAAATAAAVHVVTHGRDAATTAVNLKAVGAILGTLRGYNLPWCNTVLDELAEAAVDAAGQLTYSTRVRAASLQLTRDGVIGQEAWSWVGVRAIRPAAIAPPDLTVGAAPRHGTERFILLNGDAEFQYVSSLRDAIRPRVVGMTGMHHGAIYEGQTFLRREHIPFCPGSKAARGVLRFRADRRNGQGRDHVISAVSEAARALQVRNGQNRRRQLRVIVSRAARCAAAAVHALEAAHPGDIAAAPDKFGAVAAASAVAALRYRSSQIIGVAAFLASTTRKLALGTGTSPVESVVETAAFAIHNAPATVDQLSNVCRGGLDGDLIPFVIPMAAAALAGPNVGVGADEAGAEAASALGELWGSYRYGGGLNAKQARYLKQRIEMTNADEDVFNDLATAATAAVLASANGQGANRHRLATATNAAATALGVPGGGLGAVEAATRTTLRSSYGANPAGLVDDVALCAARWAAERMAAFEIGSSAEVIRAVLHGANDVRLRRHASDAYRRPSFRANGGGAIAFSYGVDPATLQHGYSSQTVSAGYCGHAHPLALLKYEALGWTRRHNTSRRARHAGKQGDPVREHHAGHTLLAWDSNLDRPVAPGEHTYRCRKCGRSFDLRS